MKKKWWLIGLGTLTICGGVAVAIPALMPAGPGITKANFDRVENGMTRAEVEAILLGPPAHGNRAEWGPDGFGCVTFKFGENGNVQMSVEFDDDGRVTRTRWLDDRSAFEQFLDALPWLNAGRPGLTIRSISGGVGPRSSEI